MTLVDTRSSVLVIADSDSYLKWAAGLFRVDDPDFAPTVCLVKGSGEPSEAQVAASLRTTDWTPADVTRIDIAGLRERVATADAVVLAVRGSMALVIGERVIKPLGDRPVIVTGLPGMSWPAKRRGLVYRSYADLFVLHSKAEIEEFTALGRDTPLADRFALATLPFTNPHVRVRPDPAGPIVFATQALVPTTVKDRRRLARLLLGFASAHPDRTLIIKIRNSEGERQTHADTRPLQAMLREEAGGRLPLNVEVRAGALVDALDGAAGLVTVSSTAALEALEYGLPTALVNDFGVRKSLLNGIYMESGLLASLAELSPDVSTWGSPEPSWRDRHYFHEAAHNSWRTMLLARLADRESGSLPTPEFLTDREFSKHDRLYWSASALTPDEWTRAERVAIDVERSRRALRRARRLPRKAWRRLRRAVRWRVAAARRS